MKRIIRCAETSKEDQLNDKIADIKDDFDFVLAGVDKLIRLGNLQDAETSIDSLSTDLQSIITSLAGKLEPEV